MSPNPVPGSSANQTVSIFGTNFVSGSGLKVHVAYPGFNTDLTGTQVTWVNSGQVNILINVGTSANNWTAQVINPDTQGSNIFNFSVAAAASGPTLNTISPTTATPGTQFSLTLSGSNFDTSTGQIVINGPSCAPCTVPNGVLTTKTSGQLTGPVTLNNAGTFNIQEQNGPGGAITGGQTLTITSTTTPTIGDIAPTVRTTGSFSLTVNGNNFDASKAQIVITGPDCSTATSCVISNSVLTTKTSGQLVGPVTFNNPGAFTIQVQNGPNTILSQGATLTITGSSPTLIATPASGKVGSQFTFTGTNFTKATPATLTITHPDNSSGGTTRSTTDSSGSVSFVINSQSNDPLGAWTFTLRDDLGKSATDKVQYTNTSQVGTDSMAYIKDVNWPDSSQISPVLSFTKTWQLKNDGTTTWSGYTFVFIPNPTKGYASTNLHVSGATSIPVPVTPPGQTIDLSVPMKAPSTPGLYHSAWQLQNSNGERFGIQPYVKINVVAKQSQTLGYGNNGTKDSPPGKNGTNADPVNTATGNYNYSATDLRIPGLGMDIDLARSYNSQDSTPGPLGNGWSHTFNIYVTNVTSDRVSVHYSDGKVLEYVNQPGTSTFVSSYPGIYDVLVHNSDSTWILKKTDQRGYKFDQSGKLTTVQDQNNNQLTLAYSGSNLSQVIDTVGRTFTYEVV